MKPFIPPQIRAFHGALTQELVQVPAPFNLGMLPANQLPESTTTLICGYCSTGCALEAHLKNGAAFNLTPTPGYSVNQGMACPKGWEALVPLRSPDRATMPQVRSPDGSFQPVSWTSALETFRDSFRAIQAQHGPDSLAWLGTGQIVNEELAYLGALAKFGMGILHGDGNTRQCMATSVAAYKESFGFDAPPYCYEDFEESDVLVLIGSNLCIAHPILWQHILQNRRSPEIIVIDPRRTETAMNATLHCALAPKSDLTLLYGIAHELIQRKALDFSFIQNHTEGFDAFAHHVQSFPRLRVLSETQLSEPDFDRLVHLIESGKRVSFWWTMGVNQGHQATLTAQAIINLALMTGNIGRPGTGANSITGQCNAMGSRLFSNTTNLLGGHDFARLEHRQKVASILQIPLENIPATNSLAYDQIIEAIDQGQIKGLWIIATNGAHSWIHQSRMNRILKKLDFLVVQDMYHNTETAKHAHLLLPAAGWGEKEGTFINSERRFGLVKKIAKAPGQALADFHIFQLLAQAWGCERLFSAWTSPHEVFQLLKRLTQGQPCDITGIENYRMIDQEGGIQWPLPQSSPLLQQRPLPSQRRLFEDKTFYHTNGKARFVFAAPEAPSATPSQEYPLILLTGRGSSAQWHTLTRTSKSNILNLLAPKSIYVEIHPSDAKHRHISAHSLVTISSQQGSIQAVAYLTSTVPPGSIFIPMHYPETNLLTFPEVDPKSRQPSYKYTPVQVSLAT